MTGTCLPNDATAQRFVRAFQTIVTPTTANEIALQSNLGLSSVTPALVSVVSSATVCTAAANAVNAIITTKRSNYPLYVIALGTSYGVSFAPDGTPGPGFAYVFDSTWNLVRLVMMF